MLTPNLQAHIITIGNEILIGQVVDTNSTWLAQQLNLLGIQVGQITSVSDDIDHIIKTLSNSGLNYELTIVTGGLGPTNDDLTKAAVVSFFKSRLVLNHEVLEHIRSLLTRRGIEMNALNLRQAKLPDNCVILPNRVGTAPGMWFEKDHRVYVFLPGVPFEMKDIFLNSVLDRLRERFKTPSIYHKTLLLQGIAESELSQLIASWESQLPASITLAYLPSPGLVRLRLSARGDSLDKLTTWVEREIHKVLPVLQPYYFGVDDEKLEMIIGKLLKNNEQTVSTAESCTGGRIASLLTSIPGSSVYFKGSVVAYSNEIKEQVLHVDPLVIESMGAVSEEVVREMARNIRRVMHTDYSIAVSGIAGPEGGTEQKPVGTTWIAVASSSRVEAQKFRFGDNRARNIERASLTALNQLRKFILSEAGKNEERLK